MLRPAPHWPPSPGPAHAWHWAQVGCYDGTVGLFAVEPAQSQQQPAASAAQLGGASCGGLTLLLHFAASRDPVRAVAWAPPSTAEPAADGTCQGRLFAVAGQGQGVSIWDSRWAQGGHGSAAVSPACPFRLACRGLKCYVVNVRPLASPNAGRLVHALCAACAPGQAAAVCTSGQVRALCAGSPLALRPSLCHLVRSGRWPWPGCTRACLVQRMTAPCSTWPFRAGPVVPLPRPLRARPLL